MRHATTSSTSSTGAIQDEVRNDDRHVPPARHPGGHGGARGTIPGGTQAGDRAVDRFRRADRGEAVERAAHATLLARDARGNGRARRGQLPAAAGGGVPKRGPRPRRREPRRPRGRGIGPAGRAGRAGVGAGVAARPRHGTCACPWRPPPRPAPPWPRPGAGAFVSGVTRSAPTFESLLRAANGPGKVAPLLRALGFPAPSPLPRASSAGWGLAGVDGVRRIYAAGE